MMICVIVYWAASLTVDWLSAWSNYVLEPNAGDATVDPMATSQLVHREVVQMDYCYGIVRRAIHLLNSVTVV
jgi:hypothetical protein